jgi:uncharacterized protein (TIGR01244 family)
MLADMLTAPAIRSRIDAFTLKRSPMDIRALTPAYAVSSQIDPTDLATIKAAGFTTVIDNRPDGEIPDALQTERLRMAAEAMGLVFVANPVTPGMFTDAVIDTQKRAVAASTGPVFAYCASGIRSSCVWALMNAGSRPVEELIGTPARFGYNLAPLLPMIEARARG